MSMFCVEINPMDNIAKIAKQMTNNYYLNYRVIDTLKRSKSTDEDYQHSQTYSIYDQKDKHKTKYILKLIDLEKLTNLTEFIKDISWYKQLSHYNLMSLKDCFLIDTKLYLMKPYASFGSCADLLYSNPHGVREQLIATILWQILQALRYLEDRHIMHRGITSKKIFLFEDGRVVLDDFCHCISMISSFDGKLKRQIYDYTDKLQDQVLNLAPEVIYQNKDGYSFKSDIYSLGTVACELANGIHPYIDMIYGNLSMLYTKIQGSEPILLDQSQFTEDMIELGDKKNILYIEEIKKRRFTKEFHSFVKSCVSIEAESRCSAEELQIHPFFKYQKKISHSQHLINSDTAKLLETYKKRELINTENKNIEEIFTDSTIDSSQRQNTSWEF